MVTALLVLALAAALSSTTAHAKPDSVLASLRKGNIAAAEKWYAATFAGSSDAAARYYEGRIKLAKNEADDALEAFEAAIKLNGKSSEYHLWAGRAAGQAAQKASVFRQPGLAKQCKSHWEKAIELDPKTVDARVDLIQYHLMAPGIMGGSVETAKTLAGEVTRLDPWQGLFATSRVLAKEKRYADLDALFKPALTRFADSTQVSNQYGQLLLDQKRYDEAWPLFAAAEKKRPDQWGHTYQMVKLAANSGKFLSEALPRAAALAAKPPVQEASWKAYFHFRHGQILEHSGRKADAAAAFKAALALKSDLKEAKEALNRVKS